MSQSPIRGRVFLSGSIGSDSGDQERSQSPIRGRVFLSNGATLVQSGLDDVTKPYSRASVSENNNFVWL